MQSVIPPGDPARTVIAGKRQGYLGLAINYGQTEDAFPTMTTAWQPTDAERAAIAAGANIVVRLLGVPPINPMAVYVSEVPQIEDLMPPEQDVTCSCGSTVTFEAGEHHARCFNSNCGGYYHR